MTCKATLILMLMAPSLVCAQTDGAEDAEPAFTTWQEAARENGLSAGTIASLEKNRILITRITAARLQASCFMEETPT